ncbi:MAG: HNH endonuclease [Clostridia bacterium]|nr:HNH endonuclease [Clostridia bacterium]
MELVWCSAVRCDISIMHEKKADPFYLSKEWRMVREEALARDKYVCQECLRLFNAGHTIKVRPAAMVHHVKPREEYPELSLVLSNLESLCYKHHNVIHPEKGMKRAEKKHETRARVIKL